MRCIARGPVVRSACCCCVFAVGTLWRAKIPCACGVFALAPYPFVDVQSNPVRRKGGRVGASEDRARRAGASEERVQGCVGANADTQLHCSICTRLQGGRASKALKDRGARPGPTRVALALPTAQSRMPQAVRRALRPARRGLRRALRRAVWRALRRAVQAVEGAVSAAQLAEARRHVQRAPAGDSATSVCCVRSMQNCQLSF